MSSQQKSFFLALGNFNYRVWTSGSLVSNIGTWMQRVAQDWLVLTTLTNHDATAVGFVTALQFGPQILLLPITGYAADRVDKRKLIAATQAVQGILALGLGVLTITGLVELWQVYIFAGLLGCATAFDAPARQSFVGDLVKEEQLSNAVALNSASFNASRMIGPAIAGWLIVLVGSGWVFILNSASFAAVLFSLRYMRADELRPRNKPDHQYGTLLDGFRYVWQRSDLKIILCMYAITGTLGLSSQIYIATMATTVFHLEAQGYGLLSSMLAIGSVTGALLSARRNRPTLKLIVVAVALFGSACLLAALMPDYYFFAGALVLIGISIQTFGTTANAFVQLSTTPSMRGRVMAILLAVALGGQAIGAPFVGWVANSYGARWALVLAATSGFISFALGTTYLTKLRRAEQENGRL